ncbi:MAG: DUF933 domain-containing protein [Planctomycetota bacterium]
MRIAIIGLAQSGKRTLFKLLTGAAPPPVHGKGDFPLGVGSVPDDRLEKLAAIYGSKKTKPAELEWVLFPALPSEEAARRGWFEQAREVDGLCCVVRQFGDESVYHEEGSVDPARDVAKLDLELAFADLTVVEARLERLARDTAKKTAAEREKQEAVLGKLKAEIEAERPLRGVELTKPEEDRLGGLKFLSRKACMIALNVDEGVAGDEPGLAGLVSSVPAAGREVVCLSAKIETELAEIEDDNERAELLEGLGLSEDGASRVARGALRALEVISFLTANRNEVGAHLVRRGSTAPEAAGVVHTDFESGFIRAEVMRLEELAAAGSEAKLRDQGKVALKGKDYVVQEGDIVHVLASA